MINIKGNKMKNGRSLILVSSVQYQVFHVSSNQLETKYTLKICEEFKRNEWSSFTEREIEFMRGINE